MKLRAIDLCCCAGGASVGLHQAGFDVVGVDNRPQKNYPFKFILADALKADLAGFDFIWASPPCQKHSTLASLHPAKEYPCIISPMREKLIASGLPWIMENVPGAPLRAQGFLCGTMFRLKVFRHRIFESNLTLTFPRHQKHNGSTGSHRGYSSLRRARGGFICVAGNNFEAAAGRRAMQTPWMTSRAEISQAIPPPYSRFLGAQIMHLCL